MHYESYNQELYSHLIIVWDANILVIAYVEGHIDVRGGSMARGGSTGAIHPLQKFCVYVNWTAYVMKISSSNVLSVKFSCSTSLVYL